MFDDVWGSVVRGHYQRCIASVSGYQLCSLKNETFPAIIKKPESASVKGCLYLEVSTEDLRRLDRFEGDYYFRENVQVNMDDNELHPAVMYVLRQEFMHLLDGETWNAEHFRREHLHEFMKS